MILIYTIQSVLIATSVAIFIFFSVKHKRLHSELSELKKVVDVVKKENQTIFGNQKVLLSVLNSLRQRVNNQYGKNRKIESRKIKDIINRPNDITDDVE
jgi:uncharacterized protein YoxC